LIQSLREKHINVVDIKPDRDKQSRLISQIDLFEGGSILLPKDAPGSMRLFRSCCRFRAGMTIRSTRFRKGLAWRRAEWKPPLVQRRTIGV